MQKNIRKEVVYESSPEAVWEALTNPEEISLWLMPTKDFKAEKGARFMLQARPMGNWDGKIHGEVLICEKPRVLSYTWKGDQMKSTTVITWTLRKEEDKTILVLEHTGFEGLADYILGIFHDMGWGRFLRQLNQSLKRHE